MRIIVKTEEKTLKIPVLVPYRLMGFAVSRGILKSVIKKYVSPYTKSNGIDLNSIDYRALAESLSILSEYKGTKLVDVKDKDGTHVEIYL